MKAFYISGGAGSLIQLSDGRWADTVIGDTSEVEEAHQALERLYREIKAAKAEWTEEPLYGDFSLAELAAYVEGDDSYRIITLAEAAKLINLSYRTLQGAALDGRLEARKSAGTWLTTRRALQAAIEAGKLRPPKSE